MDAFTGEVRLFAFPFAPLNWAFCTGQVMQIQQFQALAAVIGTLYGGDGRITIALPNLQTQCVVGTGQGTGLNLNWQCGKSNGANTVALNATQVPGHTHKLSGRVLNPNQEQASPAKTAMLGRLGQTGTTTVVSAYFKADPPTLPVTMHPLTVGLNTGASNPTTAHENRQPYLAMNYCICLNGEVFPVKD